MPRTSRTRREQDLEALEAFTNKLLGQEIEILEDDEGKAGASSKKGQLAKGALASPGQATYTLTRTGRTSWPKTTS